MIFRQVTRADVKLLTFGVLLAGALAAGPTRAEDEPVIGQVYFLRHGDHGRCPRGYLEAHGYSESVFQYTALYAVIGNKYGGTPGRTFVLPKVTPAHHGAGPPMSACIAFVGRMPQRD